MAAPGQRFVADPQVALLRTITQIAKIISCAIDTTERMRRDVGADQHQVGPQLLHQIEFALGAIEGLLTVWFRQSFEVTERLEQHDLQAVIADHPANLFRRTIEGQEIVLKNLDTIEPGRRDGSEFLLEITANRNCRN